MLRSSTRLTALLLSGFFLATLANAQARVADEIAPLPTAISTEQLQSLAELSGSAAPEAPQLASWLPNPGLSPEDASYKLAVQKLGVDEHRFVHCELTNHSVVTGAIVVIGTEDFRVRPGMLHEDRVIRYSELGAPPRPTAAVGTHLKNGLQMTGLVALCVAAFPVCLAALGE